MKSRLTSAAESEFSDAVAFYENSQTGIGDEFIEAVLATITKIEKFPSLGRLVRNEIRSFATRTFPYNIIYEVIADEIVIHAIAHQSRKPEYWINRIFDSKVCPVKKL